MRSGEQLHEIPWRAGRLFAPFRNGKRVLAKAADPARAPSIVEPMFTEVNAADPGRAIPIATATHAAATADRPDLLLVAASRNEGKTFIYLISDPVVQAFA